MPVYSRERRGESPEDLWENKHLSHSRFTKTHLRPLDATWEIFYHLPKRRKKTPLSAFEAVQKVRVRLKTFAGELLHRSRWREPDLNTYITEAWQIDSLKNQLINPRDGGRSRQAGENHSLQIHTLADTCKKLGRFQNATTRVSEGPRHAARHDEVLHLVRNPHWSLRRGAALSLLWKQWGSLFIWMNHKPKTHKYPWQRYRLTKQEREHRRAREGPSTFCNGNIAAIFKPKYTQG